MEVDRNWADQFPADLLAKIFSQFEIADLLESAQFVCASWRTASRNPFAFQSIRIKSNTNRCLHYADPSTVKRLLGLLTEGVRRSHGHVTELDINLPFFWDDFLKTILGRVTTETTTGSVIRRFRLRSCVKIEAGLTALAPHLPLLEVLEIHGSFCISEYAMEAIGDCCPLLRSFVCRAACGFFGDDEAYGLASRVPGLRHLEISRNSLTMEGVEAILNACPNLEHLDLSYSYKLHCLDDESVISGWRKRVNNLVLCRAEDRLDDAWRKFIKSLQKQFFKKTNQRVPKSHH